MIQAFTISASLKFSEEIRQLIAISKSEGLQAEFPNLDSGLSEAELTDQMMKSLEADHLASIDRTGVLYVLCVGGYAGKLVAFEMGYAKAKGISIYCSELLEDLGLRVCCTAIIPPSDIGKLKTYAKT